MEHIINLLKIPCPKILAFALTKNNFATKIKGMIYFEKSLIMEGILANNITTVF